MSGELWFQAFEFEIINDPACVTELGDGIWSGEDNIFFIIHDPDPDSTLDQYIYEMHSYSNLNILLNP